MLSGFLPRTILSCAAMSCLVFGLAGCATTTGRAAHHGGVENPADRPANALTCQSRETAGTLEAIEQRRPRATPDVARYLAANQNIETLSYHMLYDIDPAGRARNIRFGGDPDLLSSSNNRDAVFRMASAIKDWRFRWHEDADIRYVTGCEAHFDFFLR